MADLGSSKIFGNLTVIHDAEVKGVITGDGSGLTNLNASNLSSGTVSYARLPISSSQVSNWDTAYSWGDHSLAGYAIDSAISTVGKTGAWNDILNKPATATRWPTVGEVGAYATGSKVADSDKLDGLNSTQFLRSDVNGAMNGNLTFNSSVTISNDADFIDFQNNGTQANGIKWHDNLYVGGRYSAGSLLLTKNATPNTGSDSWNYTSGTASALEVASDGSLYHYKNTSPVAGTFSSVFGTAYKIYTEEHKPTYAEIGVVPYSQLPFSSTTAAEWDTAYGWGDHASAGYESSSNKGVANGYASLNSNGVVPSSQLPSFVDDVLEYSNTTAFPASGETGKIYLALDTDSVYRWSGSTYIQINDSVSSADQAAKLSTARTISLSGDLSGSASFDGSSNISISATVGNDSHTHDARYNTKSEITSYFSGATSKTGYNKPSWDTSYDRSLTSISGSGNGTLTLNRQDGSTYITNLSHTHSYLPLSGGAINGKTTISDSVHGVLEVNRNDAGDGVVARFHQEAFAESTLRFRNNASNHIDVGLGTSGQFVVKVPHNNATGGYDFEVRNGWAKVAGNKVYHEGHKPTPSEIDAVAWLNIQTDPDLIKQSSATRLDPHANNPTNDHYAMTTFGNNSNVTGQIATHFSSGETYSRAFNTSWSAWRKHWDSSNFNPSDYLPLAGGTLTGNLAIGNNTHSQKRILLWPGSEAHTIGTESVHNIYGATSGYTGSIGHKFYRGGGELIAQIGFGSDGTPSNRLDSEFHGKVTANLFVGNGSGLTGTASLRATGTTKADVGLGSVDNYSRAHYDGRYLGISDKAADSDKLDGITSGSFLRSDSTDYINGVLYMRADIRAEGSFRDHGIYGHYDSYKTAHIWSMGSNYRIPSNGSDFGNLYGFAYKYTNNTTGGTMAGSHQVVWCHNGIPKVALGKNVWTSGKFIGDGGGLTGTASLRATGTTKSDVGLGNVPNTDATNASNISSGTLNSNRIPSDIARTGGDYLTSTKLGNYIYLRDYDDGNSNTGLKTYIRDGTWHINPDSSTTGSAQINLGGDQVYHEGHKPTYSELGTITTGDVNFANQSLNTNSNVDFNEVHSSGNIHASNVLISEGNNDFGVGTVLRQTHNGNASGTDSLASVGSTIKNIRLDYTAYSDTQALAEIAFTNYNDVGTGWYNIDDRKKVGFKFIGTDNGQLSKRTLLEITSQGTINTIRGTTGSYGGENSGAGNWGVPIWSMGEDFAGTGSGNNFTLSSSQYGLVWLRGSHPSANGFADEGLYIYRGGIEYAAIGRKGTEFSQQVRAPSFSISSDQRLKYQIADYVHNDRVLKAKSWVWKNDKTVNHSQRNKKDVGVIAQEVENIFPECVEEGNDGIKTVDYGKLGTLNSIKANEEIELLKARLQKLESRSLWSIIKDKIKGWF